MAVEERVTNLTELAEKVGVTTSTVSMALRGSTRISRDVSEKIRQLAKKHGFTPRVYNRRAAASPSPSSSADKPGPFLILAGHSTAADAVDNVMVDTLRYFFMRRHIEFRHVTPEELAESPELADGFNGVFFNNDPEVFETLRPDIAAVQLFGLKSRREGCDRVTADDSGIVDLAMDYFRRAGIKRAAMVWREDFPEPEKHPRIHLFLERMAAAGVTATPLTFRREDTDFVPRLNAYIKAGDKRIGFFGFNMYAGLKLCCGLDSLGLMARYAARNVLVCDRTALLDPFYPHPAMIDLCFPAMMERAAELMFYRLKHPDAPNALLVQSPRLVQP